MPAKKYRRKNPTEKIVVKSKAYGEHLRSPRGSRSRAIINPAMKIRGWRLRKSTIPARLIMDALPYF